MKKALYRDFKDIVFFFKLIIRNRRTIEMLMCFITIILINFFSSNIAGLNKMLLTFLTVSVVTVLYGTQLVNFNSKYIKLLFLENKIYSFFKINFILLTLFSLVGFVAVLPVYIKEIQYFYILISFFAYNIGIFIPIMFIFSSLHHVHKLDINKTRNFNFSGITYKTFLFTAPNFSIVFFMLCFDWFWMVLLGLGLIGIVFIPYILKISARNLENRKYVFIKAVK